MGGLGPMGCGWSLSGLSVISRINKTIYYDGKTEGISSSQTKPAYALDGQRLILIKSTDTLDTYQTEQGFIRVRQIKSATPTYFKVFYPNGNQAEYKTTDGLNYYVTKSIDIRGNIISYSYTQQEGHRRINNITYGAQGVAKVDFTYTTTTSNLTPVSYSAGIKASYPYLLSSVRATFNNNEIRKYDMTYQQKGLAYELSSINSSVDGNELNPLHFYYGETDNGKQYDMDTVYTMPSFSFGSSEKNIYGQRIKFDYHNDNEGVMLFQNKIPYYEEEYATYHRIINYYSGSSSILVNNNLDQSVATAFSLTMESGFRDAFPMNIDGMEEEELVKFNNIASETTDSVAFTIYTSAWTGAPAIKYRRSYPWGNMLTVGNTKSVSPKECYQGDFNGDGILDLMIISANKPLSFNSVATRCLIVDLENDSILFDGTPFAYNLKVPGIFNGEERTPQQAYNISDKIRITDYDGDGRAEICLINNAGSYFYAFDNDENGGLICQQKFFSPYARTETVKDKNILQGDFNGDGKTDFMLTPKNNYNDWFLFSAKGNGDFDFKTLNICTYNNDMVCVVQDMNLDGQSDIVVKNGSALTTYFVANQYVQGNLSTTIPEHSVIVPTNVHRDYSTYNLVAIDNNWYARKIRIANDDHTNRLLTGVINSLGVINRYSYHFLDAANAPYTKGSNATFPFENFVGGLSVCTKSEVFCGGTQYGNQGFYYTNAVVHKQGLGFQGFQNVYASDNITLGYSDMNFNPFQRGIMTRLDDNRHTATYEYDLLTATNKTLKIQMKKEISTDKATGVVATTTKSYNNYNYLSLALTSYSDGTKRQQNISYIPRNTNSEYFLEKCFTSSQRDTRPSGYSIDKTIFLWNSNNTIRQKTKKTGVLSVCTEDDTYDSNNQLVKKTVIPYSDTQPLEEEYTYNNLGQLISRKDPTGLITSYSYDNKGRLSTITSPDGNITTRTYDVWGRLTCEASSDSTRNTSSLQWSSDNTSALYQCNTMKTNAYERIAGYDAFNREVQTGEYPVIGFAPIAYTEYDHRGRVARVSDPQEFHESLVWTEYEYDSYDRPVSITYPSGRTDSFAYDSLSVTSVSHGITTTKSYNALGDLLSVTDPSGTISYTYHKSGQPATITAPGNVTATMTYDNYNRRVSIADPSAGTTTVAYDARGNLSTQTDANGNTTTYSYDQYDRIVSKRHANAAGTDTLRTTYQYDTLGRLQWKQNSNSSGTHYSYDNKGRISSVDYSMNDRFLMEIRYYDNNGHLSSIDYESQDGFITTENYVYNHEKVAKIYLPEEADNVWNNLLLSTGDTPSSFEMSQTQNAKETLRVLPILQTEQISYSARNCDIRGRVTVSDSGPYNHNANYDREGNCIGVLLKRGKEFPTITPQNLGRLSLPSTRFFAENYTYDAQTGNLLLRADTINNISEAFAYDSLNRLTSHHGGTVSYDAKGNVLSKSDVGSYSYSSSLPYSVTGITPAVGSSISLRDQDITYNCMQRVSHISENGHEASFWYGDDGERVKMTRGDGTQIYSKYYLGGRYEITIGPNFYKRQVFYVGGDAYTANVVRVKESDSTPWKKYYLCRDRLGSVTMVLDSLGNAVQNVGYDAWGNLRNPQTHALYTESNMPTLFLERGFTGHEHMPEFGLINMNARLYDPVLGRFLSPDPYVQLPDFSQSYNRYTYCLNNPLKYVDQDGKSFIGAILFGAVVGALVGGTSYAVSTAVTGQRWDPHQFWKSIGIGAFSGAVGGAFGAAGANLNFATLGNKIGFNILSQATNSVATSAIFGTKIDGISFLGIAAGAAVGSVLPNFSALNAKPIVNTLAETGFNTARGAITGLAQGVVESSLRKDARYLWQDVAGGAISGFSRSLVMNSVFGAPFRPMLQTTGSGVFRTGGISSLINMGRGLTLGGHMWIVENRDNETMYHESCHGLQQLNNDGWASFYLRVLSEYLKYGYYDSPLEKEAREYARQIYRNY